MAGAGAASIPGLLVNYYWLVTPNYNTLTLQGALIVTAGFDPLRDEGAAYAMRLRDAGVMVDYVCFGGMIHGFAGMGKVLSSALRAVALIGATVRQAFA